MPGAGTFSPGALCSRAVGLAARLATTHDPNLASRSVQAARRPDRNCLPLRESYCLRSVNTARRPAKRCVYSPLVLCREGFQPAVDVLLRLHRRALGGAGQSAAAQQVVDGLCTAAGMIMTAPGPLRCAAWLMKQLGRADAECLRGIQGLDMLACLAAACRLFLLKQRRRYGELRAVSGRADRLTAGLCARRQRLNLPLVRAACELLVGTDAAAQQGTAAAALQLLPALALSGYGLPCQAMKAVATAHGSPVDALQALQRADLDLCRVSCLPLCMPWCSLCKHLPEKWYSLKAARCIGCSTDCALTCRATAYCGWACCTRCQSCASCCRAARHRLRAASGSGRTCCWPLWAASHACARLQPCWVARSWTLRSLKQVRSCCS